MAGADPSRGGSWRPILLLVTRRAAAAGAGAAAPGRRRAAGRAGRRLVRLSAVRPRRGRPAAKNADCAGLAEQRAWATAPTRRRSTRSRSSTTSTRSGASSSARAEHSPRRGGSVRPAAHHVRIRTSGVRDPARQARRWRGGTPPSCCPAHLADKMATGSECAPSAHRRTAAPPTSAFRRMRTPARVRSQGRAGRTRGADARAGPRTTGDNRGPPVHILSTSAGNRG